MLGERGAGKTTVLRLLAAHAAERWESWGTPTLDQQGRLLVEQVLRERGIDPLPIDRLIQPTFGMRWAEGVILCSGATDT